MLFHAYLRNGIAYIPTVARLQKGGAYMDVEPVAVEPVTNTDGLRRALSNAFARKNAFVPNPPKNNWPKPILLKYSGAPNSLALEQVLEAERLGYDSVWSGEAYGTDAVTPTAWILARTTKIRAGTGSMVDRPGRPG